MTEFEKQFNRIKTETGFIAALDQSGGSTPKTLGLYGVTEDAWSDDAGMFDLMHEMRSRIMLSPSFTGERVLGAILFEGTMNRKVAGIPTPEFLWTKKNVVPFLKVDQGLVDEKDGVQLMKPMPNLESSLATAKGLGVFGTKMRSVIKKGTTAGVDSIVKQQFDIGRQIIAAGLVPILEPEVDINCPNKKEAEQMLEASLLKGLDSLDKDQFVMLKLTLPETANQYQSCIAHPQCVRVVALSGGYPREEANRRLSQNSSMIASFSRALAEGLTAQLSDAEFDDMLNASIDGIYQASNS